jgi:fatty acid desaturase
LQGIGVYFTSNKYPAQSGVSREANAVEVRWIQNFSEEEMATHERHHIPWYLWPFAAIWKLLAVIVEMTGRLVALILGIVLMIVGVLVSLTLVGAIVGVPLAIVGLLLFVKGIF